MRNILTLGRRELGAYFNSPIAYIVIPAYLLITGYLFFSQVFLVGDASLRDFFGTAPLLFIFFLPAITMRLLAEEKRTKTIELLITMPVTDWQVVLGKFLGALGVLLAALALTLVYAFTLSSMGTLDWGIVSAGYVGLVLLGGTYIAIGLMASSWTRHQVAASLITWAITFTLYLGGKLVPMMPRALAPAVEYLSLDSHFVNISRGVLDTRDVIYYLSLIGVCLFLAVQSLDSRRWR
ncbi:MAG: ABC transporter permease subunit [Deltaproteobacteria bacterium]|nr:ABC transporter permease subunit [Deltaproteobacteria bacterium]